MDALKEEEKKTPDQWCDEHPFHHIQIIDPDGWDRTNFFEDWKRPLTKIEFQHKLWLCSIGPRSDLGETERPTLSEIMGL